MLGLYLGDGHLARFARTTCLRIYLDAKYPGIVDAASLAIRALMPRNKVSPLLRSDENCVVVTCYSKQWPCLLPQHGAGPKHTRSIELEDWQRSATQRYPEDFIRGLIHSDGCRFTNPVRAPRTGRLYEYPRYLFSNRSDDIRALFCEHLDLLGIAWRPVGKWQISVARREAVAKLDEFVGPKR
jgi:hypothetical protein